MGENDKKYRRKKTGEHIRTRMIHVVPKARGTPSRSQTCTSYTPCDCTHRLSLLSRDTWGTPANTARQRLVNSSLVKNIYFSSLKAMLKYRGSACGFSEENSAKKLGCSGSLRIQPKSIIVNSSLAENNSFLVSNSDVKIPGKYKRS